MASMLTLPPLAGLERPPCMAGRLASAHSASQLLRVC